VLRHAIGSHAPDHTADHVTSCYEIALGAVSALFEWLMSTLPLECYR